MRSIVYLLLLGMLFSFTSCREDFHFEPNNGTELEFSKDTVYLDTVFTGISSSTYTLKVYNKSNKDIYIPSIHLSKGDQSKYRIMVDGLHGQDNYRFENVEMLARDSMYIFIESTANIQDTSSDFLYTDQIVFQSSDLEQQQSVELITLIQDAVFLYPQRFEDGSKETISLGLNENGDEVRIEGFELNEDHLHFSNEKPYVIYGYAGVPTGKTLTIDAGARIHFHDASGMYVKPQAKILANGAVSPENNPLQNEIIFEGDRLEPAFSETPGQWGTIWFAQGSSGTVLKHTTIKNAVVGLLVSGNTGLSQATPDIQLENVQIYNCSNVGILGQTGYVKGDNVVINRCGQASFAGTYGGNYHFTHSTFNNNWPGNRQVSVLLNNFIEGAVPETQDLVKAEFHNCIIYGNNQIQMLLETREGSAFNYLFNHCLIKFNNLNNIYSQHPLYQFQNSSSYINCTIATNNVQWNPKFHNPASNNLKIDIESSAIGIGDELISAGTSDLLGRSRIAPYAIGAYNVDEIIEE